MTDDAPGPHAGHRHAAAPDPADASAPDVHAAGTHGPDEGSGPRPDLGAVTRAAADALAVGRAFGEPYQVGGTLVVPVAAVLGSHALAGARGTGRLRVGRLLPGRRPSPAAGAATPGSGGRGGGAADTGGFGVRVKPLGVYVVTAEGARWQPALDLNRVVLGGQAVGAVAVVALAWALRRRRR